MARESLAAAISSVHAVAIRGEATGADACRHLPAVFGQGEQGSLAHGGAQIAYTVFRDFVRQSREEDSELIASKPGDDVAFTHSEAEAIGYLPQHAVRVRQPDRAVDLAKSIEIADDKDGSLIRNPAAVEFAGESGKERLGAQ